VIGTINVQHICHKYKFPVNLSRQAWVEFQETSPNLPQVHHTEDDNFIINSALLSNAEIHCLVAALPNPVTTPADWRDSVTGGYRIWANIPAEMSDNESEEEDIE
jgi:hypothetical protein